MTTEEIDVLNDELSLRGLKGKVYDAVRIHRPTLSPDSFARAWRIQDWENATPILKKIIQEGKRILADDNLRIQTYGIGQQEQLATT